jgi:NTP pyrophosphatase (non-canonical NTP hydrolase)
MTTARESFREGMDAFQTEVAQWATANFGDNNGYGAMAPMMGMVEEVGELYHVRLKAIQRIRESARRESADAKDEEEADALGDILVYMLDYAARRGYRLSECFLLAWDSVKRRDWRANPETGKEEVEDDTPGTA